MVNRFNTPRARTDTPIGGWAVGLALATNGVMTGTWVSRLPAISDRLAVSDSTLGLALLGGALGTVLALFVVSTTCRRFGVRRVFTIAITVWATLYSVAAVSPTPLTLFATLFVIGLMAGTVSVVANASAHELELRYARPLLPRYHGMFSIGALGGSLLGVKLAAHIGPVPHIVGVSMLCAVASIVAARNIPTDGVVQSGKPPRRAVRLSPLDRITVLRQPQTIAIVGIGLIVMCTTLAEGASNNWSAIFLHRNRGTTESLAAAGFAAYAAAMAVGRLAGNWFARRVSRPNLLRFSGVMLFTGIVTLVSTHAMVFVIAAMVAWGLGVAVIFPTAMAAAAEVLDEPAVGISRVAMIGYVGFIIGPPTIGSLATSFNLGAALLVIAGVGVVLFFLAPFAKSQVPAHTLTPADSNQPITAELAILGA